MSEITITVSNEEYIAIDKNTKSSEIAFAVFDDCGYKKNQNKFEVKQI